MRSRTSSTQRQPSRLPLTERRWIQPEVGAPVDDSATGLSRGDESGPHVRARCSARAVSSIPLATPSARNTTVSTKPTPIFTINVSSAM